MDLNKSIAFEGERSVRVTIHLDRARFLGGKLKAPLTTEDGREAFVWTAALGLTPVEVRYARQQADSNNF